MPSHAARRLSSLIAAVFLCAGFAYAQTSSGPRVSEMPASSPTVPADGGLTLAAARDLMLRSNPAILAARRTLDVAAAEIQRVDVLPNPVLSAQISNTRAGHYSFGERDRLIRIEQPIERGGKRALRRESAEAGRRVADWALADAIRQESLALTAAYVELAAAQRVEALARDNVEGYARLVAAAEKRVSAGDLASVDAARLRIENARATNELAVARSTVLQAGVALAALIGAQRDTVPLRALDAPSAAEQLDQAIDDAQWRLRDVDTAIDARADVRASIAGLAGLEKARDLAASQRTRDWTLGLQTERAPGQGGSVFGVSASVPLFVFNDFAGDIARAEAELAVGRQEVERARLRARTEITRAHVQLRSAAERARRLLAGAVPEASRVATSIEFAFNAGAVGLNDLFDTRRQLSLLRAEAAQAQAEFDKARWAFRLALGDDTLPVTAR